MVRPPLFRLALPIVVATLLLASSAPTIIAATHHQTRWVDDNAGADGGPAACDTAHFTSIQHAIDASHRWDRVNVCPGTYTEQLTLDVRGIAVQAVPNRQAHLVAPAVVVPANGVRSVAVLTARAARLIGFQIDIPAGDSVLSTGRVTARPAGQVEGCTQVDVAVLVLGHRARVRNNVIDSIGDATLSGQCGYGYGIVFGQHDLVPTFRPAPFRQAAVGRATLNEVRDFKAGGILVEGDDYKARVDQNTISYLHAADGTCATVCVRNVSLMSAGVNNAFLLAFGIAAEDGAAALIEGNTITSGVQNPLGWGIALNEANNRSVIRNNDITNGQEGINTQGNTDVPADVGTGGAVIYGNVVFGAGTGIRAEDNGHDIHDNLASGGGVGMWASGVENHIHDNDFIGVDPNTVFDCLDDSPPGSHTLGTSNLWSDGFNAGATDSPMDLCHAP